MTIPGSPAGSSARANGKKDSRTELIEATQRLLSKGPPSSIRSKDIAAESGVHYGLIYHYFASKEELFRTAMEELTSAYIAWREQTVDRSDPLPPMPIDGHELWWKAAANFSADSGRSYAKLGWSYPVMAYELEAIRAAHPEVPEIEAKAHIMREICLNFGWVVFKETVQHGFNLSQDEVERIGKDIVGRS
jgi:AcrR family transcriptional regulator